MLKMYEIYEEGFQVMEGSARAHYIGSAMGENFLDACQNLIKEIGRGEIKTSRSGRKYAADWGCEWFPTLEEAQRSFG